MIYTDHYGKTKKVSDRRFSEFRKRVENNKTWLNFRFKVFKGYSREELIMNPRSEVWEYAGGVVGSKPLVLRFVNEIVYKVYEYGGEELGEFSTPESAWDFIQNYK